MRRQGESKKFRKAMRRRNAKFRRMHEGKKFQNIECKKAAGFKARSCKRRVTNQNRLPVRDLARVMMGHDFQLAVGCQQRRLAGIHRQDRNSRDCR